MAKEKKEQAGRKILSAVEAERQICSAIVDDNFHQKVSDIVLKAFNADVALFALIATGNPVLRIYGASGKVDDDIFEKPLLLNREGEGKVLLSDEPVIGRLWEKKKLSLHAQDFFQKDAIYLAAPVLSEDGNIVGLIEVFRFNCAPLFSPDEIQKIVDLGKFIGTAFDNYYIFNAIYNQAVEKEQTRISQRMHDHLCQQIAYLKIQAGLLAKNLPADTDKKITENLHNIQRVLESVYADARSDIMDLRVANKKKRDQDNPATFYRELQEMLKRYTEAVKITSELMVSEQAKVLYAPMVAEQLRLIIQEALYNISKHAQAKSAIICFNGENDDLIVTIDDDGKGFDPMAISNYDGHQHFGLQIMKERAECIGAKFSISSELGKGTRIAIVIPSEKAA